MAMPQCPRCGSSDVRISRRHPALRVIGFLVPIRPYRCRQCRRRIWRLDSRKLQIPRRREFFLVGVVLAALVLGLLYVFTMPYETHRPRLPGERSAGDTRHQPLGSGDGESSSTETRVLQGLQSRAVGEALEIELQVSSLPRRLDHFLVPESAASHRPGRLSIELSGHWQPGPGFDWKPVRLDHPLAQRVVFQRSEDSLSIDIELAAGVSVLPALEPAEKGLKVRLEPIRADGRRETARE